MTFCRGHGSHVDTLKKGCRDGDLDACIVGAQVYAAGRVVPRDVPLAEAIYWLGCDEGHDASCRSLDRIHEVSTPLRHSELLPGIDAKNVRNIVLMRPVNSMIEFKQIIGRGTRTFEGRNYFTVYDFVKAHEKFDDPQWDGDPADIIIDPPGEPRGPRGPKPVEVEGYPPGGGGSDDPTVPAPPMIEVKLADGHIVNIAATTFWGPGGKPISSRQFIERLFGDLPSLFTDEEDLLAQWSDPDTRKALLERLAERSYDASILNEVQKAMNAESSDVFDVLSCIAYDRNMRTRQHRADVGRRRIEDQFDPKMIAFLDYVLESYVEHGAENLDRSKLSDFVKLKYGTAAECAADLGGMQVVVNGFIGFQRHLYSPSN